MNRVINRCASFSLACVLVSGTLHAAALNLYEWVATAPIVITAEHVGSGGKYAIFEIDQAYRDTLVPGSQLRINVRKANRARSQNSDLKALKFETGSTYILLIDNLTPAKKEAAPTAELVRGVMGVRQLPREGAEVLLTALKEFIRIQDLNSEQAIWSNFERMLEANNPHLLENALDQFLKFRRGEPDHLADLIPLLYHPRPDFRDRAARLIEQIITHRQIGEAVDADWLREELIGSARRDSEISVRISATKALAQFQDAAAQTVLEEIASSDTSQEVRFTAEVLLYRQRQAPR